MAQSFLPTILMVVIALLIIFLAIAFVIRRKKGKIPTDYYNLFVIGIIWLIIGVPMKNYVLSGLGLIFTVVGLTHKKKWQKNRRTWEDLSKSEKNFKLTLIIILSIMLIAGLIMYWHTTKQI